MYIYICIHRCIFGWLYTYTCKTHLSAHVYFSGIRYYIFSIFSLHDFHDIRTVSFDPDVLKECPGMWDRCSLEPWKVCGNLPSSTILRHQCHLPGSSFQWQVGSVFVGFFVGRNPEVTYGGVVFLWKLIRIYRIVGWSARNRDMPYAWNIYDSDGWTLWDLQLKQPPCTPVGCLFHV